MLSLKNFINTDNENKNWFEKNWFFATTFVITFICIFLFVACGSDWMTSVNIDGKWHWDDTLYFNSMFFAFLNGFAHLNLQHVLLNMLCFLAVGLYLERKVGSIKLLLIILALGFFTAMAITANISGGNPSSLNWRGFSGINYALYAFIIIDFLFFLRLPNKKKSDWIISGIILGLILIAMCYSSGTDGFAFTWYPYDLFNNLAHYTSFVVGIIFALTIQISKLNFRRITK